jgi:serine/threonine protein kinase
MPLGSGTRLGPNEVISPIGAGGTGEVYQARNPRLNRTVAVKVQNSSSSPIVVVLNWASRLAR